MGKKIITLNCYTCNEDFERDESRHNYELIRRPETYARWFCSKTCLDAGQRTTSLIVKQCEQCKSSFNLKTKVQRFCSSRCAAIFNNPKKPEKPKKIRIPKEPKTLGDDYRYVTIRILRDKTGTRNYHTRIRTNARVIFAKSGKPMECEACGYSLHVDVCHIIDVSRFSLDTPIAVVNSIENLVALDRRCHWEFDHGYLLLK